jgi:hypothetical protein
MKLIIILSQRCDSDIFLPNNYIEDRPSGIGVRSDLWNAHGPGLRRLGVDRHPMIPVPWEASQ